MKRIITLLVLAGALLSTESLAQIQRQNPENIHYQWMDSYGLNLPNRKIAFNPTRISLPSVRGFNAYTADLHMHTIYSDAQLTPEMRVYEAYMEGIDILAITDHHPSPRTDRGIKDLNIAYKLAAKAAKGLEIKIIRGFEITGSEPVGHINVLFTGDLNKYVLPPSFSTADCDKILEMARKEDAFITANHPGWPDQNSDLSDYLIGHIEDGTIGAIEIFNHKEFYPMAIDHAVKYNLAMFACTDAHYPTYMLYDLENNHRDITIVFARDKSDEGIKEALRAQRTLAWSNNMLCGEESLLLDFIKACVKPVWVRKNHKGELHFRLYNSSSIPFYLSTEDPNDNIYIPAGGYAESARKMSKRAQYFSVDNLYCGSREHPSFPLNFLLDEDEIAQPFVNENSLAFDDKALSFRFAPCAGSIYYTLDGSEPDENANCYDGGTISLTNPCSIKAITVIDGKKSSVYTKELPFAMAGRFKGRKQGINFRYYEGHDISSTSEIDNFSKPVKSGIKSSLEISEGIDKDYFAYVFEGVIKIEQSGLYKFTLMSNDGSDLYIDGVLACDNNTRAGYTTGNGSIYLQKGMHRLRIRYFEGYGGESFALKWQTPGEVNARDLPNDILFVE